MFHFFLILVAAVSGAFSSLNYYELVEKDSCPLKMNLFLDRAVLMKYADLFHFNETGEVFDCDSTVTSRSGDTGVISVIQRMHLKRSSKCSSFFTFWDEREKQCDEITLGMVTTEGQKLRVPDFISDYGGPFNREYPTYELNPISTLQISPGMYSDRFVGKVSKTYAIWNNVKELLPHGAMVYPFRTTKFKVHIDSYDSSDVKKEDIIVAFTAYKDCDGGKVEEGWFNCGYGLCILDKYVNDDIVNCPFGDCRDEMNCEKALFNFNKRFCGLH